MAKRAFIIPRRNDLAGMNLQINDLWPNSSQHNLSYDGEGQTHYLRFSYDQPGATTLAGGVYASGSLTTAVANALSADVDTNGAGGVDSRTTVLNEYGLVAYLRERVNAAVGGANTVLTANQATALAQAIVDKVDAGSALDAAALDAAATVVLAATDFSGNNSVNGIVGSNSFGSVEDVLRILQGETYVVPKNTILTANGGGQVFKTLAQRKALVAAAVAAGNTQYVAEGHFLAASEPGYRSIKSIVSSGHVKASAGEGTLAGCKKAMTILNPAFDYAGLTANPVAKKIGGGSIPATGLWNAVAVYDSTGAVI